MRQKPVTGNAAHAREPHFINRAARALGTAKPVTVLPPAVFPFAAVTGMDPAKQALLLLAVDPGLKGVLIAGGPGTAKSMLARGIRPLLAAEEHAQADSSGRPPFVEAPLGVTDDHLFGGLHLERSLLAGRPLMADGLVARAHGGILYVDEINLLDRGLACRIAGALNAGIIHVERDGVSGRLRSDFALIGTYDPAEGEVSPPILDSAGIHVTEAGELSGPERAEMLSRVDAFGSDPHAFIQRYAAETAVLRKRITEARSRLPKVRIKREDYRRLCLAALRLGVESNRADIFAAGLARAHAALLGRYDVREDDLEAAIYFVLWPRATNLPRKQAAVQSNVNEASGEPAERRTEVRRGTLKRAPHMNHDELIAQAIDGRAPEGVLSLAGRHPQEKHPRQIGRRKGRSPETGGWNRGRYVRAVARRPRGGKVALDATLRAAAPFQIGRRSSARGGAIEIRGSDLRFKQFRQKAGVLIVFAVDASGSMSLNRIHQAKGALIRLLREAYVTRDNVALISFRADRAQVLLPPSRSVERARTAIDSLPVGGGTPLAAGLCAALDLARHARLNQGQQSLLVLLTDGRANVVRGSANATAGRQVVWQELEKICAELQSARVTSVVIDTNHPFAANGEGERLAGLLGGRHVYLPRLDAGEVYDAVVPIARAMRVEA